MNKRSVSENLFYNMLYQIVVTVLPIVTTPYVARVLGLEANGIHSYTESMVTYFVIFGSLGTSLYGIRRIAQIRDDNQKLANTAIEIFLLRLMLMVITLLVYIPVLCVSSKYAIVYRIQIINILAGGLDISWFYQGIEDFKKVTIRNFIVKIVFVVALFLFIKSPEDLYLYVFIIVVSALLGNVLMLYYLPQYINLHKISNLKPLRHLKQSIVLFVPQVMNYIYALLDRSMLGWMTTTDYVGIYDQAQRLVRIVSGILLSLGYVMMAKISNLSSNNDVDGIKRYIQKSIDFTIFFAIPATFGLIAVADDFIPFFLGNEYLQVIPTLKVLSILIITISFNSILGVQLLLPMGKDRVYTMSTVSGAFVNVVLNVILIPRLGVYGACVSSVLAEMMVFCVSYYHVRKMISIKKVIKNNYSVVIAAVIMYLFVCFVSKTELMLIVRLLLEIVGGGILYIGINWCFKNEILSEMLFKLIKLVRKGE